MAKAVLSFLVIHGSHSESAAALPGDASVAQVLGWVAQRLQRVGLIGPEQSPSANASKLAVTVFAQPYELRCQLAKPAAGSVRLLVRKRGAVVDRLLGRAGFDADDAFIRVFIDMLEREPELQQVSISWK